jgi:hypothetical protein
MLLVSALCVLLLVACSVVHYEALRALSYLLPRLGTMPRYKLVIVVLGAFIAHAIEVCLYAVAYYWLAWHQDMGTINGSHRPSVLDCLYLSATTYSSLGYGDVIPEGTLKLLAATEVLIGLVLIGWTASYLYISMERFWEKEPKQTPP